METIMETPTLNLIKEGLQEAISYQEYKELVDKHAAEGSNTGPEVTEALAQYTLLNQRRMKRWAKTFKLDPAAQEAIANRKQALTWLVLTESWCGDAAHATPIMDAFAQTNPNIEFKVLLRDENLPLMDAFLTNGARSIPKLIAFDPEQETVVGTWGPRPTPATAMVNTYKAEHGKLTPEFKQDLQVWYNKDKGKAIAADLLELL